MRELTMATFCHYQSPAVVLQHANHFTNLHPATLSKDPVPGRLSVPPNARDNPRRLSNAKAVVGLIAKLDHGSRADQHWLKESPIQASNGLEANRAHESGDLLHRHREITGL